MIFSTFSFVCWPFKYFLWWNVHSSPLIIFKLGCFLLLLSFRNTLYTWILIPYQIWFIGWIFTLLIVSFDGQKVFFFKVWLVPFFCFCFCFLYLKKKSYLRSHCQGTCHEVFSPMFSSRNFTVLGIMFKSLIHFETSMYGVR